MSFFVRQSWPLPLSAQHRLGEDPVSEAMKAAKPSPSFASTFHLLSKATKRKAGRKAAAVKMAQNFVRRLNGTSSQRSIK